MTWPFQFDNDRIAELFNNICGTLISATFIFLFVYYNRKKPKLKVKSTNFWIGRNGVSQLISDPVSYIGTINFAIENESIYTAYNLKLVSIGRVFPSDTQFLREAFNLKSNEEKQLTLAFNLSVPKIEIMKNLPESFLLDNLYILQLEHKYKVPFYINISYRNDDNRNIKKRLMINFEFITR